MPEAGLCVEPDRIDDLAAVDFHTPDAVVIIGEQSRAPLWRRKSGSPGCRSFKAGPRAGPDRPPTVCLPGQGCSNKPTSRARPVACEKRFARGRLARQWGGQTPRSGTDVFGTTLYEDGHKTIVDAVGRVAERRGVPRAQVALAWLLQQPAVTAPIIGATNERHLSDAVAALELTLDKSEHAELESPYLPHLPAGF
ncbi:aldo/keto reductase [Arthrobacter sp. UYEF3]|uniref:aldo/keto reductase n=1 Tax=Arthrobacter sp. UYEF3 TaxID=1756365 RepID=UPI00339911C1